jgi:hypothetical protein
LKKSLPFSSMTIKAGKSAPATCVLGALPFGLVVLLFDQLSASTASFHVALGRFTGILNILSKFQ